MKQKILSFLGVFTLLISVISLAGCGEKEKNQIYLLSQNGEMKSVYEEMAKSYKAESGTELKLVFTDEKKFSSTLSNELSKDDAPTVLEFWNYSDFTKYKTYFEDMKSYKVAPSLADEKLAITDDDKISAIPISVDAAGLICNTEIFTKYLALASKKTDVTKLDDIDSFEKLRLVTEDMTANKEALGIKGAFATAPLKKGESKSYIKNLIATPVYYEIYEGHKEDDIRKAFDDMGSLSYKYGDNFKNLFDLQIMNTTVDKKELSEKTNADAIKEFATGEAAFLIGSSSDWQKITSTAGNVITADKVKMLPLYSGIDGEKGQGIIVSDMRYLGVNKNAGETERKLAEKFISWLTTTQKGMEYLDRISTVAPLKDETVNSDNPLAKEALSYLKNTSVKNVYASFTLPEKLFDDTYEGMISAYLAGEKTWTDFKDYLKDKWQEIMM